MTPDETLPLLRVIRDGTETTTDISRTIGITPAVAEYRLGMLHSQGYLHHRWQKGVGTTWALSSDGVRHLDANGG